MKTFRKRSLSKDLTRQAYGQLIAYELSSSTNVRARPMLRWKRIGTSQPPTLPMLLKDNVGPAAFAGS
jgi:hypothetical protein